MFEAQILCGEEIIVQRTYCGPTLTVYRVVELLRDYVVMEKLNEFTDCVVRARTMATVE